MDILDNPFRRAGLPRDAGLADGEIVTDPAAAMALHARCPRAAETPLLSLDALAAEAGVAALDVKDERARMGLGSFKALGAAHAIAKQAAPAIDAGTPPGEALAGRTFVCASAGNHGMSVAAGAAAFGARAIVFLAEPVPEAFAGRLRAKGAEVVRAGAVYEESMAAAGETAARQGFDLLPDSSWPGCTAPARDVMEGYLVMAEEAARQVPSPPTHIFLQAGVGGLAAACAAAARNHWGAAPLIVVVEPEFAPALTESVRAGRPVVAGGPVSAMGRLDCKEPSHLALKYLAREADRFMTVGEEEAAGAVARLAGLGIATTASGAAGIAGLLAAAGTRTLGLDGESRVLAYLSEGPEDG